MKIIKVKGCGECPWAYEELAGDGTIVVYRCMSTDGMVPENGFPEWCPLDSNLVVGNVAITIVSENYCGENQTLLGFSTMKGTFQIEFYPDGNVKLANFGPFRTPLHQSILEAEENSVTQEPDAEVKDENDNG